MMAIGGSSVYGDSWSPVHTYFVLQESRKRAFHELKRPNRRLYCIQQIQGMQQKLSKDVTNLYFAFRKSQDICDGGLAQSCHDEAVYSKRHTYAWWNAHLKRF